MSVANDAYNDCLSAGFSDDQCASFERCVQTTTSLPSTISLCSPDPLTGVMICQGGTTFPYNTNTDPIGHAEAQCYADRGSPPFPVDNDDPPLPPEVPPYDPYNCPCEAHNPNPVLIFLSYHPVVGMLVGATVVLVLFGFVQRLV